MGYISVKAYKIAVSRSCEAYLQELRTVTSAEG